MTTKLTLSDLFPSRYLRGQDLTKPILARITGLAQETAHPRPGVEEQVWVLRFEPLEYPSLKPMTLRGVQRGKDGYGVVLRKTLASEIAQATGRDSPEDWAGSLIVLYARALGNGKVGISARAPKVKGENDGHEAIASRDSDS